MGAFQSIKQFNQVISPNPLNRLVTIQFWSKKCKVKQSKEGLPNLTEFGFSAYSPGLATTNRWVTPIHQSSVLTILELFYILRQETRNEELATKGPNKTLKSHNKDSRKNENNLSSITLKSNIKDLMVNESTISLIWLCSF